MAGHSFDNRASLRKGFLGLSSVGVNWNYNVVSDFEFMSFKHLTEFFFSNVVQFGGVGFRFLLVI